MARHQAPSSDTILTTSRPHGDLSPQELMAQMSQIGALTHKNPLRMARDYVRLAAGPGRISPSDFIELRLFDEAFYRGADPRAFVGKRRNYNLCYGINYRHDWLAVMENKIASVAYLDAHALPTIPLKIIYAPRLRSKAAHIAHDGAGLEAMLSHPGLYPLFGKPAESQNSLGSVALASYAPRTHEAETTAGMRVPIGALVREIETHYSAGYLFQALAVPEKKIARICGTRLATVRIITIDGAHGAEIFRTAWKVPAAGNIADNYWRSGNVLADIDAETGVVGNTTSGAGLALREHETHPETGARLRGFVHPHWDEMRSLALEGARLMRHIPLIGWDIACTDRGPVIVEMNECPDAFLMQVANRRGILDEQFNAFSAYQERLKRSFHSDLKRRAAGLWR